MREIEFRAWHIINEKHYVVGRFDWDYQNNLYRVELLRVNEKRIPLPILISSDKIILEQYTGIKDKNGVKIFEGDIVRCDNVYEDEIIEGKIFYDESFGGYVVKKLTNFKVSCFGLIDYEVIGNIHEEKENKNE